MMLSELHMQKFYSIWYTVTTARHENRSAIHLLPPWMCVCIYFPGCV